MPLIVTLDLFSGLPNPKFAIPDTEAQRIETLVRSAGLADRRLPLPPPRLGYRGIRIERAGVGGPVKPLAVIRAGEHVESEKLLVDYARRSLGDRISQTAWSHVTSTLERYEREGPERYEGREERGEPGWLERIEEFFEEWREPKDADDGGCPPCVAADAPTYDPGPWNTEPTLSNNNCYNYANNQATNTFAQPGRAHGYTLSVDACGDVQPGAVLDGLAATTNFTTPLGAGQGWYVALVLAPGFDYHWYRQDTVGCWSHKPGHTPARNVDNSGNPITDPQTADRGPYSVFCSYMIAYTTDVIY